MALFGKKKDAPAPAEIDSSGGVSVADADGGDVAPTKGKRVKAAREPKSPKSKTVKNGVAVGLNIGNQYIKAVEVTSKNGELSVTAMGAVPTPPESYTNGNVLSVSALSGAIKELWRGAGIKSKVAVTSVAGTGALVVRVIEVPKMTDGELRDNMKVDADRYIPFPPSEVVMDFKALRDLPSDPDAPNMEVLLAAAQREIIDLHVKVVQSARLDPRAIDVEPIAAARCLQLERRGGDGFVDYNEVTAIVNLGASGSEISILRGDLVVFTRAVPNGGNSLTQAIAEGLGLPFSDAERVKIESADALAPAGYGSAPAGEDFGFGDTGGDFNFGGDEFSGGDFNSAFDEVSADPTAAASDDPFDLDFFNQGPPQNEPGAGHAQKEGDPDNPAPTPAFSFDFGDLDSTLASPAPAPQSTPPAEPTIDEAASAEPAFDFSFSPAPDATAPNATPEVTQTPAPVEFSSVPPDFNFGAELSDEFLPSMTESEELPAMKSAPPALVPPTSVSSEKRTAQLDDFSFDASDTTPLPTLVSASDLPEAPQSPISTVISPEFAQTAGTSPIASAFDFDNFDLPGVQSAGLSTVSTPIEAASVAAPATTTAIVPTPTANFALDTSAPRPEDVQPAPFDFDDSTLAARPAPAETVPAFDFSLPEPAPTPASESVAKVPVPDISPIASSVEAPSSDFDLDSIFGTPTAPIENSEAPGGNADVIFGAADIAPTMASVAASGDDFDLSDIDMGPDSGFSAGFGGQTNDFSVFGAGLVEGNALTDAVTLYSLIHPSLEELSNELRRSLEFHLGRYPDATISRLVLLGGGAKLRNLDVFFTQTLGVPTTIANPFAYIKVQTPSLPPEYATENGPLCAVALGLALRDFVE